MRTPKRRRNDRNVREEDGSIGEKEILRETKVRRKRKKDGVACN